MAKYAYQSKILLKTFISIITINEYINKQSGTN